MAKPTLRYVNVTFGATASLTHTTDSSPKAGDTIVVCRVLGYQSGRTHNTNPSAPAISWTTLYTVASGNYAGHRVWSGTLAADGAVSVTTGASAAPSIGNDAVIVVIYSNTDASPIDGTPQSIAGGSTTAAVTATSPTGLDDVLLGFGVAFVSNNSAVTWTPVPTGMTELLDQSATASVYTTVVEVCSQDLTSSGTTGTRTFTTSATSAGMTAGMFCIKGSSGGGRSRKKRKRQRRYISSR